MKLNIEQFKLFNQDDQFAIFDVEGYGDFEDFNKELDKLFEKFDKIIVTKNDQIYGEKDGKREELHSEVFGSYGIALETVSDC